jgi:hypothetical protein
VSVRVFLAPGGTLLARLPAPTTVGEVRELAARRFRVDAAAVSVLERGGGAALLDESTIAAVCVPVAC